MKKNILLVLRGSALNRGMNTGLENLVWGLSRRGHNVIIISGGKLPESFGSNYDIPYGVTYRFVGGDNRLYERLKSEVERVIEERKVDCIISRLHSVVPLLGDKKNRIYLPPVLLNQGALYPSLFRRIVIGIIKNGPLRQIMSELSLYQSRKQVSHVIAVSEAVARSLISNGLLPETKMSVIYRGIEHKKYFAKRTNKDHQHSKNHRILFVGNIIESKGVGDLIMSLEYLDTSNTSVQIVLCGAVEVNYQKKLTAIAERFGYAKNLVFRGCLAQHELIKEYQSADFFVFPSYSEGLAKALLEAMSCELPVICGDIPSLREVVVDGYNGLIVPIKNPRAIAKAILRFAAEPELARKCALNARRTVVSKFSVDAELDQWEELIYRFTDAPEYRQTGGY